MDKDAPQKAKHLESSLPLEGSSEVIDQSLLKIATGTGIIFIGSVAGLGLIFLGRVLVARFFTQAEYGIFSLGYIILHMLVVASLLGLRDGAVRQISFYRGKSDLLAVKGIVLSSVQIVLVASVIFSLALFFTSDILSVRVFHEPALAVPLKAFAFAIPCLAVIQILVSVFRGFGRVKEYVYFENILRTALFPLFLLPVVFLSLPFLNAIYAFTVSVVVTCLIFAIYTIKKSPVSLKGSRRAFALNPVGKELLLLSLPLLGVFFLNQIIGWTDTLMLGFFKTSEIVGLYNAAQPLARLVPVGIGALSVIYIPVVSQLFSKNLMLEIKRNYEVLTKWLLFFTLPLVLLAYLFPEAILGFIFGHQYIGASLALQILVLGCFIPVILGPCGQTLLSMGRTKVLMGATVIGALLNIVLNVVLIPSLGAIGAAIATAISIAITQLIILAVLYKVSKIHPFSRNYLKPLLPFGITTGLIYVFTRGFSISFWMLPITLILLFGIYTLCIFIMKAIDKEDVLVITEIENRTGLNLTVIKNVLGRYSH